MSASSNQAAIRIVKEVTFGTTPASPTLQDLRYTGESLNYNLSNITSDEVRSDRMTSDLVQVSSDASGDLNAEMSYGSFDDLIEGAFASTFNTNLAVSGTDIAAVATDTFTSSTTDFVAEGLVVGRWIRVGGFTDTTLNTYHKLLTVATNAITVEGTIAAETAGNTITMVGQMMRNGVVESSFTVQKYLADASPATMINFNGARVGSMSMNFATGQILTSSFNMMALGATVTETQFSGATVTPASTTDVMNSVSNLVDIREDGSASATNFSSLTLNLSNNLRAQDAIGSLPHIGIALSRLELTGDISAYFANKTLYEKYINATPFSLSFRVGDAAGNAYIVTLPRVKFESGTVVSGGLDQDIMVDGTWRAIIDPTTNCMVQIDKFAA